MAENVNIDININSSSAQKGLDGLNKKLSETKITGENMGNSLMDIGGGVNDAFTALQLTVFAGNKSMIEMVAIAEKGEAVTRAIKGSIEAWTAAQKLLNAAMYANPIGIIIAAATALIAVVGGITAALVTNQETTNAWIEQSKKEIPALTSLYDQLKNKLDEIGKAYDNILKFTGNLTREEDKAIEKEYSNAKKLYDIKLASIEQMKVQNKSAQEIHDAEDKALTNILITINRRIGLEKKGLITRSDDEIKFGEELLKKYVSLNLEQIKINKERNDKELSDNKIAAINNEKLENEKLENEKNNIKIHDNIIKKSIDLEKEELNKAGEDEKKEKENKIEADKIAADAKAEVDTKYFKDLENKYNNDKEVAATTEEDKISKRKKTAQTIADITNSLATTISNMQSIELQAAGDNEEKKKQIIKKYANIQMGITIASIIANTAAAMIGASAPPPVGVGPIFGPIIAAAAATVGATQLGMAIAQRAQIAKMAKGGLLEGPSHSSGGIMINAEGGESIINANSTRRFAPILSAINQAGDGNSIGNSTSSIIDYNKLASLINDKQVVIYTNELQAKQNLTDKIITKASIK